MTRSIWVSIRLAAFAWVIVTHSTAQAQRPAGIPELNSRPGAEFTIYLNVGGFDYTGLWSGHATAPGYTAPLNDIDRNTAFSAVEQEQIRTIWAQVASSYVGFNVNVTTIDPYDSVADPTPTDAERQSFYDSRANMLHTVIGSQLRPGPNNVGTVKWFSDDADGVSGLGVAAGTAGPGSGNHTNWMFTEAQAGAATGNVINGGYIGAVTAHENAHAFGLEHQGDYNATTNAKVNEYSLGDASDGPGSYVPIIGQADGRQRVAWRSGDANVGGTRMQQNDIARMLSESSIAGSGRAGAADLVFVDDAIGGTINTATPLPLVGNMIDVNSAFSKGVIVPVSMTSPNPIGSENYVENWHSFFSDGGDAITLALYNGTDFLVPGSPDLLNVQSQVGTLRSKLSIHDSFGSLVGMAIEDPSTLFLTFSEMLTAGHYTARVQSFGGRVQDAPLFTTASYFDMGAYFLTGSGFDLISAIPEPSSLAMILVAGSIQLIRYRRRNAVAG